MRIYPNPMEGKHSPWGNIQHSTEIVPGITTVSTSSHGGIKLDRAHNAKVPKYMRAEGGWYEEDCDWAIPFCVFETEILSGTDDEYTIRAYANHSPLKTLMAWYPEAYEKWSGIVVMPGESHTRDRYIFEQNNVNNYVTYSAVGSHSADCPAGMVLVFAIRKADGSTKSFLVNEQDYAARGQFSFVVDTEFYQEVIYCK